MCCGSEERQTLMLLAKPKLVEYILLLEAIGPAYSVFD